MGIAKQFLEVKYGPNVDQVYKPRGWGPEGAHEAIRPTKPLDENQLKRAVADNTIHAPLDLKWSHYSLYNLIFTRFIASQMAPAIVIEQKFTIQMQNSEDLKVEVQHDGIVEVVSYGWALVDSVRVSPKLSVGETFSVNVEKFWRGTTPQYRLLTEGEVVSMMKQKGIGRPSTYAATVQKLKKHGYIIASKKLGYLIPTAKGILAYEILSKNFPSLVCEEATRKLEEALMNIESGKVGYQEQLRAINNEIMELYNQASGVSQTAICQ
jgi:reverse gyrase